MPPMVRNASGSCQPRHPPCAEPLPMALLYPHRRDPARRVRLFSDWLADLLRREIL